MLLLKQSKTNQELSRQTVTAHAFNSKHLGDRQTDRRGKISLQDSLGHTERSCFKIKVYIHLAKTKQQKPHETKQSRKGTS